MDFFMLVAGIWFIFSGRIPSWIIGGGKYRIEGNSVRLIGILFTLPVLLTLGISWIMSIAGQENFVFSFVWELATMIIVVIISGIIVRRIRTPINPTDTSKASKETE
jgi:hypothetical protein